MYVSTLHDFVKAMGGELKITAKFLEGTVEKKCCAYSVSS
jgi:hypothetical protein